jgi:internalin A
VVHRGKRNNIGQITTAGAISEVPIPTATDTPGAIAVGPDGALWFVEANAKKIRRLALPPAPPNTNNCTISTVAGDGSSISSGDGGPATSAGINIARGVAVGQGGTLYVTDAGVVRKVDPASQIISRAAGGGQLNLTPLSHAPALNVDLTNNWGLAADNAGNYYIAESGGHNVDWVDAFGILHVLTNLVSSPGGVAADGAGNVYIADSDHCLIVKVPTSTTTGNVTVVAGNGTCGYSGDGGPATSAQLFYAEGVALDAAGNVYIADSTNHVIRKVSSGVITTVAGTPQQNGYSGDGHPSHASQVKRPDQRRRGQHW